MTDTPLNFREAALLIPDGVKRVHHGRDPLVGFDCHGPMFFLYKAVGKPIDEIDMPYGEHDSERSDRLLIIRDRMALRFASAPLVAKYEDGDVVVLRMRELHLGVVIAGKVLHMTEKLSRIPVVKLLPYVAVRYQLRN